MAGLLDFFGDGFEDPKSAAIMALSAGLLQRNLAGGLLGANQAYSESRLGKLKEGLLNAQIAETQAQAQERAAKVAQATRDAEIAQKMPTFVRGGGLVGGAPVFQTLGDQPMFSQPASVTPMRQEPAGFDAQAALTAGAKPEQVKAYIEALNAAKQKVARTVKGMGPDGREYEYQVDDFGNKVGDPFAQYRAPISVNRGNSNDFLDAYTLEPKASFKTFQSPDSVASNAVAIRGQNLTNQRAIEQNNIAAQGNGIKLETELRKEFADLPEVKNYKQAYPSYKVITEAAKTNTRQADINLIYGLAKLYDPNSVVREGEYSTIANSQAIPDWLKGAAQGLTGGSRLSSDTKNQILNEAKTRISAYQAEHDKARSTYTDIATQRGIKPENVFTPIGQPIAQKLPANPTASSLTRGTRYELPGGVVAEWDGFGFKKVQ